MEKADYVGQNRTFWAIFKVYMPYIGEYYRISSRHFQMGGKVSFYAKYRLFQLILRKKYIFYPAIFMVSHYKS